MKPVLISFFVVTMVVTSVFAQTPDADRLLGVWQTAEKDGRIELYKSGAVYAGRLIWGVDMFERDGKTYRSTIKLRNGKLEIRGYVGLSLFGKTVTWSRVN